MLLNTSVRDRLRLIFSVFVILKESKCHSFNVFTKHLNELLMGKDHLYKYKSSFMYF